MTPYEVTSITLGITLAVIYACVAYIKRKAEQETKELKRIRERNSQLAQFRAEINHIYGIQTREALPPYSDMLYSSKDLKAKEWIDPDKTFNLN